MYYTSFQILFFQKYPEKIFNLLKNKSNNYNIVFVENIDNFLKNVNNPKRALVSLSPNAWIQALNQYPNIKSFNIAGFIYEMVKILNENGYIVDIVDLNCKNFIPTKEYDLFIGHGGNCKSIIDGLSKNTKIIQYIAGSYWKSFNKESKERYENFIKRKKINCIKSFRRTVNGLGEEYLNKKANILFGPNCPRMVDSYGGYKQKFFFTGWAAYTIDYMEINLEQKDYNAGKKNFLCVGCTGGNIQKGLDLIIETFAKTPDLNLYIFCKIEDEVLNAYKNELILKNIHYIYHWRFKPFHNKLRKLLTTINFTIHAPINTGLGTAFIGSMGLGLIPVGYVDLIAPPESCVLADSWDVNSLVKCVRKASKKSEEWCRNAALLTKINFEENWSVENFRKKFNILIKNLSGKNIHNAYGEVNSY